MKQRLITGIFIVLASVLAIVAKLLPYTIGDYIFDIFALVISIVMSIEMASIMDKMNKKVDKFLVTMYSIFNYAILICSMKFFSFPYIVLLQLLGLVIFFIAIVVTDSLLNRGAGAKNHLKIGLNSILACIYPAFMFSLIILINHIEIFVGIKHFSMMLIILVFAITYMTDTFAYLVGRTFKGPKLAPKVSPNKTISGAIGGLLGGIAASMIIYLIISKTGWAEMLTVCSLSWWHFLILGAVSSVLGQSGDLFESFLKRKAGVKDSGNLFPGHGGMMDRYDAMTFVSTFVFIFILLVVIV